MKIFLGAGHGRVGKPMQCLVLWMLVLIEDCILLELEIYTSRDATTGGVVKYTSLCTKWHVKRHLGDMTWTPSTSAIARPMKPSHDSNQARLLIELCTPALTRLSGDPTKARQRASRFIA